MNSLRLFLEPLKNSTAAACNVTRIGIYETMPEGIVDRPAGTGDWMMVCFHDPVFIKTAVGITKYPSGSFVIWSDTNGHYYGNPDAEWTHSWVHFAGKTIAPLIIGSGFTYNNIILLPSPDIFTESLHYIYRELVEQINPDAVILQNLFQNMLCRLVRQIGQVKKNQVIPLRILKIKNSIESHPAKKHTISKLAKEASMSVPNFCAEFKKYVGVPPIKFLIKVRLQQAWYLLYEHKLSIGEIAEKVGYHDIFHFSKQFKKHFGVNPSYVRKANTPIP